jgi:hypothetical protein
VAGGRIAYPTDRLLAVVDDPSAGRSAAEGLVAAGLAEPGDVEILLGPEDAARIDGLGRSGGLLARAIRLVQFTTMDQMPDLYLYEAAVRDSRAVIAVRVRDRARMLAVRDRLGADGAHFMNFYGRFATEELTRWRGPELAIPETLRR